MERFNTKLKKQNGFTLIEMLIVVAIIAILVAVSIPLVGMATERAEHATDAANERAAKAEILLLFLTQENVGSSPVATGTKYYYDAAKGSLSANTTGITGYGKHDDHKGDILKLTLAATTNEVLMSWVATSDSTSAITTSDTGLCSLTDNVEHATNS